MWSGVKRAQLFSYYGLLFIFHGSICSPDQTTRAVPHQYVDVLQVNVHKPTVSSVFIHLTCPSVQTVSLCIPEIFPTHTFVCVCVCVTNCILLLRISWLFEIFLTAAPPPKGYHQGSHVLSLTGMSFIILRSVFSLGPHQCLEPMCFFLKSSTQCWRSYVGLLGCCHFLKLQLI